MISFESRMAKIISSEIEAVTRKPGWHSRFTAAQDLAIARKVAAAKVHTPSYEESKKRFEAAALNFDANSAFKDKPTTWKAIQDRYKRPQDQYGQPPDGNQRLSRVGGGRWVSWRTR